MFSLPELCLRATLHPRTWLSILLPLTFFSTPAIASPTTCKAEEFAKEFVTAYLDAQPLPDPETAFTTLPTLDIAECHQDWAIAQLTETLGPPIGYKVAVTSAAAQAQIGSDSPLPGVFFAGATLPDGSAIAADSGGRLVYELDLLVRVGSDDIANAESIEDVAEALDAIVPFIEVADLMVPPGSTVTAPLLVAINAGARWGLVGEEIPVVEPEKIVSALEGMQVELADKSGQVLVEARGSDLMGHPLNAVLFLLGEAERRGWKIEAGDVISVGSFGRFAPVEPGLRVQATYYGLPGGAAKVSASFK